MDLTKKVDVDPEVFLPTIWNGGSRWKLHHTRTYALYKIHYTYAYEIYIWKYFWTLIFGNIVGLFNKKQKIVGLINSHKYVWVHTSIYDAKNE